MVLVKVDVLKVGFSELNIESNIMKANCTSSLILDDKNNIIVDTLTAWDSAYLKEALEARKLNPEDITHVVCTHGHSDHIGNLNMFTNALHIVGQSISRKDEYILHSFDENPYKLSDSIEVIATPGHTLSDVSVIVKGTSYGTLAIVGDLFEKQEDIRDPDLWMDIAGSENPTLQYKNRQKILQLADYIIPGHGAGFQFRICKMVSKSLKVDDLVWAKMKGYSPWPGKIVLPPTEAKPKKYHHYVFFFGSNNYAWIPDENIELHNEKLVEKYGNKKTGLYQTAVETIVERSKGISKYQRSNESSKAGDDDDDEIVSKTKDEENIFANNVAKPKRKSFESNSSSVSKKLKQKPPKKLSTVKRVSVVKKPIRKRTPSSNESEDDSDDSRMENLYEQRSEPNSPSSFLSDDSYAQLISHVPPNLGYQTDEITGVPPVTGVLQRKYYDRPDTPPIDLTYESDFFKSKNIEPTTKKIGFLGLGKISQGIVKNLCHSGHSVVVWNIMPGECDEFAKHFNVQVADTPADVLNLSDIVFNYSADSDTAKNLVFGNCGVIKELERTGEKKDYVEMTSMDPKISESIGHQIRTRGGRYLEAPISGSRIDANEGTLLVIAAGDKTLYEECKSCFDAISKKYHFVGVDVGTANKYNLINNMVIATTYAAIAESLALVSRIGLDSEIFIDIIKESAFSSDNAVKKGMSMIRNEYVSNITLKKMQQDLNLGLKLGDKIAQSTPIFATTNEVYKHCKSMRYGDHDVSAVFEGTRP